MKKSILIAGIWVSWMTGAATSDLQEAVYCLLNEDEHRMVRYRELLNVLVIRPAEYHGISRPLYFHSPSWPMLKWCMEHGADLNCVDGQGHGFLGYHLSTLPLIDKRRALIVKKVVEQISGVDPDLLVTTWYGRQRIPIALVCARELLNIAERGARYSLDSFWRETFDTFKIILAVTPRDLLQQSDGEGNCLQTMVRCRDLWREPETGFVCTQALTMTQQRYAEVGLSTDPDNQELILIANAAIAMPVIFEQRGRCDCVVL